jgi:hypothetical protein
MPTRKPACLFFVFLMALVTALPGHAQSSNGRIGGIIPTRAAQRRLAPR